jgi:plasmid maintenance system antidote protein VapI
MPQITADLAREFQAPDRITALVRTADALSADEIDRLAATLAASKEH